MIQGKIETHEEYKRIINEHSKENEECIVGFFYKEREKLERIKSADREHYRQLNFSLYTHSLTARFNKNFIFSEEQLCHLVADLFGAGLDTTLTTLKWALLYLASYPETQELIRTEIGKLNEQKFFLTESDLPQTTVSKIY